MSGRPLPTANVGVDYELMEGNLNPIIRPEVVNSAARLTEFLRDFKSVDQQEDLYGDGLETDMDSIEPKYMALMVNSTVM